ncbi:MAG: hypothetical protein FWB75_00590 [Oscillospiraceae bacterium]|nr:hypothetical protein [Oscillospiraceae bacterium]
MNLDELLHRMVIAFFMIFTGIALAVAAIRALSGVRADFFQEVPWMLLLAALTNLMHLVLYSKKELSRKNMIIRNAIALAGVLIIVTALVSLRWYFTPVTWGMVWVSAVVVFSFVVWLDIYRTQRIVSKISKKLKSRYKD